MSYSIRLALFHPILMDVYLAVASIHLAAGGHPEAMTSAIRLYNSAIRGLSRTIEAGESDGCEDWLMLASIGLCVFEVRCS